MQLAHLAGGLEVGKRADIIGVERSVSDLPTAQISETRAELTRVDGTVVFGEGAAPETYADGFESGHTEAWSAAMP